MAIPWMIALKVIPWGDVIEHAPKVLSAARKLLERQHNAPPAPTPLPSGGHRPYTRGSHPDQRLCTASIDAAGAWVHAWKRSLKEGNTTAQGDFRDRTRMH